MFPLPATSKRGSGSGRGARFGRWTSRVRGAPEVFGELPVACLAEEIETPGDGQVRALITIAGNPVVSTPNAGRLGAALDALDFMVSVDIYLNETTRRADVILPAPSHLERAHFDLAFYSFAVRNVANYSPPVLEKPPTCPTSGRRWCSSPRSSPARAPTPTWTRSTTWSRQTSPAGPASSPTPIAAGPSGSST